MKCCDECRAHIETLQEQITQLREALGVCDVPRFELTDAEWQLVGPLFKRLETHQLPVMTHDQMRAVYSVRFHDKEGLSDPTMRSLISYARHKLKPHGYEIQPVYGRGYELVEAQSGAA